MNVRRERGVRGMLGREGGQEVEGKRWDVCVDMAWCVNEHKGVNNYELFHSPYSNRSRTYGAQDLCPFPSLQISRVRAKAKARNTNIALPRATIPQHSSLAPKRECGTEFNLT